MCVKCEFGPYTLLRRHAIGGMSMVYVALDHTLNREVALKILSEEFSANESRISAFEEEARITASFNHPNVVRVLTTGRAFGRFYIAMELVPGGHFEHQIRECGKIPEADVLRLAIEVAHGLKAAHAAGLIHRDVKPGNILLTAQGQAKLVDFGLALVTHGGKAQATEIWATPYYVPPETVEGQVEDFRSDIYAFGATLYHALSGRPSCGEESMATEILREAKKRVLPLSLADSSISPETCRIVERAMAYHPKDRFSSYDEMISSLEAVLSHLKSGRPEPIDSAAIRRAEKNRKTRLALSAAGLTLGVLAGLALTWTYRSKPPQPAPPPTPVTQAPVPVLDDPSTDIAKIYREAREAIASKQFPNATRKFLLLHRSPEVQEPTRTWAGVEAVLANYLAGQPAAARQVARDAVTHARAVPPGSPGIGESVIATLDQLEPFPPLAPPKADATPDSAAHLIACMLAGLKNWEQGMPGPALACFNAVVSAQLPQDAQWASIYQALAADYLLDAQTLAGPLFTATPADAAACEATVRALEDLLPTLKTQGRACFNLRAWQADLKKRAQSPATAPPAPSNTSPPASP
jgi:serine/threonine protein kinase